MTDCLRCGIPLDDRDDERGALVHVACPEPALDEAGILRDATPERRFDVSGSAKRAICPACHRAIPKSQVGDTPLAKALYALRGDLGITTREAAARVKIGHATYYRAERGRMPDVLTFFALCEWVGKPMQDMMPPKPTKRGKR